MSRAKMIKATVGNRTMKITDSQSKPGDVYLAMYEHDGFLATNGIYKVQDIVDALLVANPTALVGSLEAAGYEVEKPVPTYAEEVRPLPVGTKFVLGNDRWAFPYVRLQGENLAYLNPRLSSPSIVTITQALDGLRGVITIIKED